MKHNYSIHQLKCSNPKAFLHYNIVVSNLGGVDFNEYKQVYAGEIYSDNPNPEAVLEILFTKFNVNHPAGFKGHSLSVSDIVVLDGVKYYCDSFGWKTIE